MANIEIFGTLVRNDGGTNRDKIVQGTQVEGGYFVCNTLPTQGTWATGQLCYCESDSKFYQYNGTNWVEKIFGITSEASKSSSGLMSSSDKNKLDGIDEGANKTVVDTALSANSTNPVQGKVIYEALTKKVDTVDGKGLSTNDFTDIYKNSIDSIIGDYSQGLQYTLIHSDSLTPSEFYSVSGIGTCTDSIITIPSVYNGLPVCSLDYGAFKNCTSITRVHLPSAIYAIPLEAFSGCTSLTEVSSPNGSINSIGTRAFEGCSNLLTMDCSGVQTIGNYAFYNARMPVHKDAMIQYGSFPNLLMIGEHAFEGALITSDVYFGSSIITIGDNAFANCGLPEFYFAGDDIPDSSNWNPSNRPVHAGIGDTTPSTYSYITTELDKKVDKVDGKGLSTNDYTTAEKDKLAGLSTVATSGSYDDLTNKPTIPNAFSNIEVSGQTTVSADTLTDTLTLVAGDNVTITTDADNDTVTIAATDTTYNIIDDLETEDSANPLSAKQGVIIKALIDALRGDFSNLIPTFVGTNNQYEEKKAEVPEGTIVIITDDETGGNTGGNTSSVLGTGVLGYMILG